MEESKLESAVSTVLGNKIFLGVLITAVSVRMLAVFFLDIEPEIDYKAYFKMAQSLVETGLMDDGFGNLAFFSAGYPLFLSPFFLLFGSEPIVAQILNIVLGVISVALVYLCAIECFSSERWATVSAAGWALYPPAITYTEYLAKENLLIPLILLFIFLILRFPQTPRKLGAIFIIGFVYGLCLVTGSATLFLGVLIICAGLYACKRRNIGFFLKLAGLCVLGLVVALGPWMTYTTVRLGEPVLNTNGGFNLYLGNNPNAEVGFVGIEKTPIGEEWHEIREKAGEVAAFGHLGNLAKDYALEHPGETLLRGAQRVVYFWTPPFHLGNNKNPSYLEKFVRLLWLLSYLSIVFFSCVGLLKIRSLNIELKTILAAVILYCAIHAATYVIFRYRLSIMPLVIIFSTFGFKNVFDWVSAKAASILPTRHWSNGD